MPNISSKNQYYYIEEPDQLELLASSVRQDILDHLEAAGPSSVTELSRSVGLSADALYYHVRKLLGAGLLVERGTRPGNRRDEAVFTLPSRRIRLRYDPADPDQALPVGRITSAMLRSGDRDFQAGLKSEDAVADGRGRNLWSARVKGWLDAGQLREVNELLKRLHRLFHETGPGDDRTLCSLTWSLAPVTAQPVRRPIKEE